ncbi:MAG: response regulator, partial [Deltaproteobacteria bacterium]|nr:response regulator [Deltaproteobacteria bacterium]
MSDKPNEQDSPTQCSTVLVIDDNEPLLRTLRRILKGEGYKVSVATNGSDGLELVDKEQFDVIISDVAMPGMGGIELLKNIRSRDLDVPVILMTGEPAIESAIDAMDLGASKFLLKPIDMDTLKSAVGRAIKLHRLAKLKQQALDVIGAQ